MTDPIEQLQRVVATVASLGRAQPARVRVVHYGPDGARVATTGEAHYQQGVSGGGGTVHYHSALAGGQGYAQSRAALDEGGRLTGSNTTLLHPGDGSVLAYVEADYGSLDLTAAGTPSSGSVSVTIRDATEVRRYDGDLTYEGERYASYLLRRYPPDGEAAGDEAAAPETAHTDYGEAEILGTRLVGGHLTLEHRRADGTLRQQTRSRLNGDGVPEEVRVTHYAEDGRTPALLAISNYAGVHFDARRKVERGKLVVETRTPAGETRSKTTFVYAQGRTVQVQEYRPGDDEPADPPDKTGPGPRPPEGEPDRASELRREDGSLLQRQQDWYAPPGGEGGGTPRRTVIQRFGVDGGTVNSTIDVDYSCARFDDQGQPTAGVVTVTKFEGDARSSISHVEYSATGGQPETMTNDNRERRRIRRARARPRQRNAGSRGGLALTITAASREGGAATVSLTADRASLTVEGAAEGEATITLTAEDTGGGPGVAAYDDAIDKTCRITNNSGKAVVILNAFNSSTNVAHDSTKQGYLQELEMLPLDGGDNMILEDGATGAVVLDQTYTDPDGNTRECYIYDLLVSTPNSLYPVMAVSELLDFDTNGYPDVTITRAAADNMDKGLNFCRNIMTAPGSKMSVGFQAAITEAAKKSTVEEMEQVIADFFNQYDTFAGLDFASYVAVSTWLRGFAYLWGMDDQGRPGQTYYVYSAPAEGELRAASEGAINVTGRPDAPSPADPTDRDSGLNIEFVGSDGSRQALTFDDGQFIDGGGGSAIALNGGFGYRGTFTGKESETTVWPMLAGAVLNKPVVAIPLAPDAGSHNFWTNPTFQNVLKYSFEAIGVLMAIDFVYTKVKAIVKKLRDYRANDNNGGDPDDQQQQEAAASGDRVEEQAAQENQNLVDRAVGPDTVEVPRDDAAFQQAVDEARASGSEAYRDVATDNLQGGIDSADAQLRDLAQIEINDAIETAFGNLKAARDSLEEGDLSSAGESLSSVNEALPDIVEHMGDRVSEELQEQVAEAVEAQTEAVDVAEETAENSDRTESGDEEPFEDPLFPEE